MNSSDLYSVVIYFKMNSSDLYSVVIYFKMNSSDLYYGAEPEET
jgi:hypothetical protein